MNREYDGLEELLDVPKTIEARMENVAVRDGIVYYYDTPVENVVCDRIIAFMQKGLPFEPLMAFLNKIMENPSRRSVKEGYKFLEAANLTLTEDGDFIAYKAVTSNLKDKWTGKIDNSIGRIVSVSRNEVDDDCRHSCSYGLHVGTHEYATGYGRAGDVVLVVKVNPRDIIAVPYDDAEKMRVCRYEVIAHEKGKIPELVVDEQFFEDVYLSDEDEDEEFEF